MIHTFGTMGTVVSIDLPGATNDAATAAALGDVESAFSGADATFSLYRAETPLSRVASGEITLAAAGDDVIEAYASAIQWRRLTGGAFTPNRPDGVIDLSGIVKARTIAAGAAALISAGIEHWCINAGGDILTAGNPATGASWTVGIVDPADRGALFTAVTLTSARPAVATSGSAERGDHIWRSSDPHDFRHDQRDARLVQVSVIAGDIVTADVLATAIVAGGVTTREILADNWPIDVLTIDGRGRATMTPGFEAAMRSVHRPTG